MTQPNPPSPGPAPLPEPRETTKVPSARVAKVGKVAGARRKP